MSQKDQLFFIFGPKDEAASRDAVSYLTSSLRIEAEPMTYTEEMDEDVRLEKAGEKIEQAQVIVCFLTKESAQDSFFINMVKSATNLNKRILPITLESGLVDAIRVKNFGGFSFRQEILRFSSEEDRQKAVEFIHTWLGLPMLGDIVGQWIDLSVDVPCKVNRGTSICGESDGKQVVSFKLAKGTHVVRCTTKDGDWNDYSMEVKSNEDAPLALSANLKSLLDIKERKGFPISDGKLDGFCDVNTNTGVWFLIASSIDSLKYNHILDHFLSQYRKVKKRLPDPPSSYALIFPNWLDYLVYIGAVGLCAYPLWYVLVLLFWVLVYVLLGGLLAAAGVLCFYIKSELEGCLGWLIIIGVIALCRFPIVWMQALWNPFPEQWANLCEAFSWTLLWSSTTVAVYWGCKLFCKGSFATWRKSRYEAEKLNAKIDNDSIAKPFNNTCNSILQSHFWKDVDLAELAEEHDFKRIPERR